MANLRRIAVALALASLAGCPDSRTRGDDAGAPDATTDPPDATIDAPPPDAPPRDAPVGMPDAPDASLPPLPDDEPDVPPGARPSDDPGGPWSDPPVIPSDVPCCSVVPADPIDDDGDGRVYAFEPRIAWADDAWAVAWHDSTRSSDDLRSVTRRLGVDARPISEIRELSGVGAYLFAMAWGNHRMAVASDGASHGAFGGDRYLVPRLAIADADGRVRQLLEREDWANVRVTALARHAAIHGWVGAASRQDGGRPPQDFLLAWRDDDPTRPILRDLPTRPYDGGVTGVVSLASRVVVARADELAIGLRTFAGPDLVEAHAIEMEPGAWPEMAAFRDVVVVATPQPASTLVVYDPFEGAIVEGPLPLPGPGTGAYGIGADSLGGTIALCYRVPIDSTRLYELELALVGPDGSAIGAPVTLGTGYDWTNRCAIASHARGEYVVVWSAGADSPETHELHAATVRVAAP